MGFKLRLVWRIGKKYDDSMRYINRLISSINIINKTDEQIREQS